MGSLVDMKFIIVALFFFSSAFCIGFLAMRLLIVARESFKNKIEKEQLEIENSVGKKNLIDVIRDNNSDESLKR